MSVVNKEEKAVDYDVLRKELTEEFLDTKRRLPYESNYEIFITLACAHDTIRKMHLFYESGDVKMLEKLGCSKSISNRFSEYMKLDNKNADKYDLYRDFIRDKEYRTIINRMIMVLITAPGTDVGYTSGSSFDDYNVGLCGRDLNIILLGPWQFRLIDSRSFKCLNYGSQTVTNYCCGIDVIKRRLIEDLVNMKRIHKKGEWDRDLDTVCSYSFTLQFPWFSETLKMVGDKGMVFVGKRGRYITKVVIMNNEWNKGKLRNHKKLDYTIDNYNVYTVVSGKDEYKLSFVGGIWIVKKISSEKGLKFKWKITLWERKFFFQDDDFNYLMNYQWFLK